MVGTGALSHDINRVWHKLIGKPDPYKKIGEENDRSRKGNSEYVWALKDINFDVHKGEVVGIIGRNGAGKSTLLKILSRTTTPTTGSIKLKGRIASLLEVGTGFHPELSGRDNIFLNGAILGMTKSEIKSKFDEIVDFAGVERYIDTPVKRYSSGMYVRLAFGVAAHLEPEILIVDEVLAVGDAEFQKKALGKMKEVSANDGRTVLFVSHNMGAIKNLCSRSIILKNGRITGDGETESVVMDYLKQYASEEIVSSKNIPLKENKNFQVLSAQLLDKNSEIINKSINVDEDYFIQIEYLFKTKIPQVHLVLNILNESGEIVYLFDRRDFSHNYFEALPGKYQCKMKIPNPLLKPGFYFINLGLADQINKEFAHEDHILAFEIKDVNAVRASRPGSIYLPLQWDMEKI